MPEPICPVIVIFMERIASEKLFALLMIWLPGGILGGFARQNVECPV